MFEEMMIWGADLADLLKEAEISMEEWMEIMEIEGEE